MKMGSLWTVAILAALSILTHRVTGQENAQTRIAQSLVECYEDNQIFERDNRLPMTTNMLIELIRKVEDSTEFTGDIRQLAVQMVHRFRQDGIERAAGVVSSATILPFSPSGFQFSKHRIILSRLLQGNAISFPNATLTAQERCTLHFMMSSSIDLRVRGDENQRCSQLSQYRSRVPRALQPKYKSNYMGDVEFLDDLPISEKKKRFGRMEEALDDAPPADEEEAAAEPEEIEPEGTEDNPVIQPRDDAGLIDIASNTISQCPVENGVISTGWGAVAGGPLMAGIATGVQPENIQIRELLALSRGQYRSSRQQTGSTVDNRWAATIAGDLAEIALLQGPQPPLGVGAPGTFNSTTMPRWYFLTQRERHEMTDAEIRGGMDGLILSMNIAAWRSRVPTIKLSQVLDMYYSQRGVMSADFRACNRNQLFTGIAPVATMLDQTNAFATVLDREMQLRVTLSSEAISTFSDQAANALSSYIPSGISTLPCGATAIIPSEDFIFRARAELFIYLDVSWTFSEIQPAIAHLLNNLDVSRFGTVYTLLNAMDGSVIVPRTNSLADLYSTWNLTRHQDHPQGFSIRNVMENIHLRCSQLMDVERTNNSLSLMSKLALVIPNMGGVSEADGIFADNTLRAIRENIPDARIIFMSGGTINRFERFVLDPRRDIFAIRTAGNDNGIAVQVNEVVVRMLQVPRRIINPRCGANWQMETLGNNQENDFVEPMGVNYYRLHPNYFFRGIDNGQRRVRVQGHGYGVITVCWSRQVENPRVNMTTGDVNCRQLNQDSVEINLNNFCDDSSYIHHCPAVFISVQGGQMTESSTLRCTEADCRFPDNMRYSVQTENLGCFNAAGQLFISVFTMLLPAVVLAFTKFLQ